MMTTLSFFEWMMAGIFATSASLIVYHHVGYPVLLKWIAGRQKQTSNLCSNTLQRHYLVQQNDKMLPSITIVVPAYNEAHWIADKIRNLASLDYPADKLRVVIACDGCTDNTVDIAQDTIQEAICSEILFEIHDYPVNRGKVAVINDEVAQITSDITALSDVSALISVDALLLAAAHFEQQETGVVNASYRIWCHENSAENAYWQYQTRIKATESSIGSSIGSHGAFYLFRTKLFTPLSSNTINDDFILPMSIVKQGHKADYETEMVALELERSELQQDYARRLRISAGNMQQLLALAALLNPKFGGTAFTFFSGKGLRLLTPYLMLLCLITSLWLMQHAIFAALLGLQLAIYLGAMLGHCWPTAAKFKPIRLIHYLVTGHLANLLGGLRYLLGKENGHWTRVHHDGERS
ncbi:TPA: glycosyltransferase [Vibrio vulnificus]|nr:glycosyltransferase [Vibrio vulnificus]